MQECCPRFFGGRQQHDGAIVQFDKIGVLDLRGKISQVIDDGVATGLFKLARCFGGVIFGFDDAAIAFRDDRQDAGGATALEQSFCALVRQGARETVSRGRNKAELDLRGVSSEGEVHRGD